MERLDNYIKGGYSEGDIVQASLNGTWYNASIARKQGRYGYLVDYLTTKATKNPLTLEITEKEVTKRAYFPLENIRK